MPFTHIVKVINPFRLIQKLRNAIDKLLVENRKLACENCRLKLQLLCVSDKLSHEVKKHSRATAMIDDLISQLEECDQFINYLVGESFQWRIDLQLSQHAPGEREVRLLNEVMGEMGSFLPP